MTKENFINTMTILERKIKERQEFLNELDMLSDSFIDKMFNKFDVFEDYISLIETSIFEKFGFNKNNFSDNWLQYFVIDCECDFSKMIIQIDGKPFPIHSWKDVWNFYAELSK